MSDDEGHWPLGVGLPDDPSWPRGEVLELRDVVVTRGSKTILDGEGNPIGRRVLDLSESNGRPVDLLQLPDGSMLVSDDKAGAIYRISYSAS